MIRLFVLDCDGVLTDGGLFYGPAGEEMKRFDVRDGLGIRMLIEDGVEVAIVSGRGNAALERRAADLGIGHVHLRVKDKRAIVAALQRQLGISRDETAAMGDDLPDLAMFDLATLRIAPADAEREIVASADIVTARFGGRGAVRDAVRHILSINAAERCEPLAGPSLRA